MVDFFLILYSRSLPLDADLLLFIYSGGSSTIRRVLNLPGMTTMEYKSNNGPYSYLPLTRPKITSACLWDRFNARQIELSNQHSGPYPSVIVLYIPPFEFLCETQRRLVSQRGLVVCRVVVANVDVVVVGYVDVDEWRKPLIANSAFLVHFSVEFGDVALLYIFLVRIHNSYVAGLRPP